MYIYIYQYVYVNMYVYQYMYRLHVCISVYVHTHACISVYVYVCILEFVYTRLRTIPHIHTHTQSKRLQYVFFLPNNIVWHVYVHTHIHASTKCVAYASRVWCIHVYIMISMWHMHEEFVTYKYTNTQTHTQIYMYVCIYIYIYIYTHVYIYTHTHVYIYNICRWIVHIQPDLLQSHSLIVMSSDPEYKNLSCTSSDNTGPVWPLRMAVHCVCKRQWTCCTHRMTMLCFEQRPVNVCIIRTTSPGSVYSAEIIFRARAMTAYMYVFNEACTCNDYIYVCVQWSICTCTYISTYNICMCSIKHVCMYIHKYLHTHAYIHTYGPMVHLT
jgi:hypothetical protein